MTYWGRDPFNEFLKAKYHSSWEELMKVYIRIKGSWYHTAMLWRDITTALLDGDILKTWEAIVVYIKWFHLYNNQKKMKKKLI